MNFSRIVIWILIIFIVALVVLSYVSEENKVNFDDIKDVNLDKNTGIKQKGQNVYTNIKDSIIFGSSNRQLPVDSYFCQQDNCEVQIIDLIEDSKDSIDCAMYDISLEGISDSLVDAKKDGVNVRMVTDYHNLSSRNSKIGNLKAADIPVISNATEDEYMHNKFCVFDEKTVLLGSLNFTLNGNYKNNNDILVIEDKELALEFTEKINEFFDGNFSQEVSQTVEQNRIANSEVYFCPEDDCSYHVQKFLDNSQEVNCMLFSFTLDEITDLIVSNNIDARFILEERNIDEYSEYSRLKQYDIPVILDKNPNSMHHKFCVFDSNIVMTGSLNLSRNGTLRNDESIIFINDSNLAGEYNSYFDDYWSRWS